MIGTGYLQRPERPGDFLIMNWVVVQRFVLTSRKRLRGSHNMCRHLYIYLYTERVHLIRGLYILPHIIIYRKRLAFWIVISRDATLR